MENIWAGLSVAVALASYGVYIRKILKGAFRPHGFSWLVWSILTWIGFAAQMHEKAGPGSVPMATAGFGCLAIAALSLKYGEKNITRSDWVAFICALTAIAPWILTQNPLYSVILVTVIDGVGFWPTFRKSWASPHHESTAMFAAGALIFLLSLAGLRVWTVTTTLYPAALVLLNSSFVVMLLFRRRTAALLEKEM